MHIYQELKRIAARWGNSSKQFCFNKQFRWVKPEVSFDNKQVPTEQANLQERAMKARPILS